MHLAWNTLDSISPGLAYAGLVLFLSRPGASAHLQSTVLPTLMKIFHPGIRRTAAYIVNGGTKGTNSANGTESLLSREGTGSNTSTGQSLGVTVRGRTGV